MRTVNLTPTRRSGGPFLRVYEMSASSPWARVFGWKSWRSGQIADYHIERNEGPAEIAKDGGQVRITRKAYELD